MSQICKYLDLSHVLLRITYCLHEKGEQLTRANLCHGLPWIAVHSLSCVWLFVTPWSAAHQASLFFTIFWSLLRLMSIESVIPSNQLILCCPLPLLLSLAFPSIRVFSSKLALHVRGQSVGTSASASVLPMNIQH